MSRWLLATVFIVSGTLHFVATDFYAGAIPLWLPEPELLVVISGVAEIAGGVGLLVPYTRRAAGWGLLLLLLAVWPANFQMLADARAEDASAMTQLILALRLPLQLAIAWWVWRAAGLHLHRRSRSHDLDSDL